MPDLSIVIRQIAILAIPLLMGVTFHEVAHGYAAYRLGDPTAKRAGRLTLNPIKHLDFLGTMVFILTRMIGWAKPVPVNPRYFKDPRRGMMLVSMAGPGMNFALAVTFALLFKLTVYVLWPMAPQATAVFQPLAMMLEGGVFINLALGLFNLIPVPPLDGSKILAGLLPSRAAFTYMSIERYGFIILILLLVSGVIERIILPLIMFFHSILI